MSSLWKRCQTLDDVRPKLCKSSLLILLEQHSDFSPLLSISERAVPAVSSPCYVES